jgi:aspartate aminotransferase
MPLSSALSTNGVLARHIDRLLEATGHPDPVELGGSPYVALPEHVRAAYVTAPARSTYVDVHGLPALRAAIGDKLKGEGLPAATERVLVTNGAMHALDVCFSTMLDPGDAVLMARPGYFIDGLVRRARAELHEFPMPAVGGYRPDWDAAERAVTPATQVLFLNSPVNPTGYVYTDEDLERAWRIATDHDLWIVSDESYSHFTYGARRHRSVAELDTAAERTVIVRSFSKDYAMPGWRLGYAVFPELLVEEATGMLEWMCLCVNQAAQAAGLAALTGPQEWISGFRAEAERLAGVAAELINAIDGLHCPPAQGGMNLLVDYGGDIDEIVRTTVTQLGFAIQPGEAFGAPDRFRFQFGGTETAVRTALARLASAFGGPPGKKG